MIFMVFGPYNSIVWVLEPLGRAFKREYGTSATGNEKTKAVHAPATVLDTAMHDVRKTHGSP